MKKKALAAVTKVGALTFVRQVRPERRKREMGKKKKNKCGRSKIPSTWQQQAGGERYAAVNAAAAREWPDSKNLRDPRKHDGNARKQCVMWNLANKKKKLK